jgi:hypothetical protein
MALDPGSVDRLDVDSVRLPGGVLGHVWWRVAVTNSRLAEQT